VVDDNAANRYLLEKLLEAHGDAVTSANDGAEALDRLRHDSYDLIVSDILMPRMDGFQLCRELKADAALKDIPFIFYTATYTDPKDEALALSLGADRFLIKPAEPHLFVEVIEEVIGRAHQRPEAVRPPPEDDAVFLQKYNARLVQKLEAKAEQASRACAELEREVRERRKAEASLHLAQQIGRVGSWEIQPGTRAMACSAEAFRLLGREAGGPSDHRLLIDAVAPEDRAVVEAALAAALAGTQAIDLECRLCRPGGGGLEVHLRAKLVPGEGAAPDRLVGTLQDITERKRAEAEKRQLEAQLRQAQRMEVIGSLAAGIAHDFNNILAAILGHAGLLKDDEAKLTPEALRNGLDQIIAAGERGREMTRNILVFGHGAEEPAAPCQVKPLVEEAVRLLRATVPSTVAIETALGCDGLAVMADPGSVHRILINLCKNAVQAIGDRAGVLQLALAPASLDAVAARRLQTSPGLFASLSVRDNGCGMDPRTIERMFEPFFTTKGPGQGTGLGLSVVHGIVKRLGGGIEVESAPGEGTVFRIYLPLADPQPTCAAPEALRLRPGRNQHILYVDDEPQLAQLARVVLRQLGYRTTIHTDPRQALADFERDPQAFDLLVTDLIMPGLNGPDLARQIAKIRPDLPLLLTSGLAAGMDENQAREHGFRALLAKPLPVHVLSDAIHQALTAPANPPPPGPRL
jgi:CheY-like chemotaxis protein